MGNVEPKGKGAREFLSQRRDCKCVACRLTSLCVICQGRWPWSGWVISRLLRELQASPGENSTSQFYPASCRLVLERPQVTEAEGTFSQTSGHLSVCSLSCISFNFQHSYHGNALDHFQLREKSLYPGPTSYLHPLLLSAGDLCHHPTHHSSPNSTVLPCLPFKFPFSYDHLNIKFLLTLSLKSSLSILFHSSMIGPLPWF